MFSNVSRLFVLPFLALLLCACTRDKPIGNNQQTATTFDELFRNCATKNFDALILASSDRDNMIRRIAVASLTEIADTRAAEQLRTSLMDPDDFAREAAAHGLGVLKDPDAVATLKKLLDDPAVEVRNAAAWALAKNGQLEQAMVERLGPNRDPAKEAAVRLFNPVAQMKLVAEHDEGFSQHVLLSLSPTEPMVSEWAASRGREQVIKELNAALEDEAGLVTTRLIAAHSLVALRTTDVGPLLKTVRRSDKWPVRLKSLAVLGALEDKSAVRPLIDLMNTSEDLKLKSHVANTLGHIGDKQAVAPLMEILAGPEYVGTKVIRPSMFDYQGTTAWRKLKKDVQVSAATALGRLGDRRAETLLRVFADPTFRSDLAKRRDPHKPADAIDLAIATAPDADEEVRRAASQALAQISK
ncbi:MAG TPA: HEAT repeat domain-containing protein [Blastocatellia bacterium]|nr:HEAT repeat domain-containing protein [Blastocatellia bacterium]